MAVTRRECSRLVALGIASTAGCLSPSEGNTRTTSTLVVANERDRELELRIRFENGDIVLFADTLAIPAGESQRLEDDLSRGATQVDVFVEFLRPQEGVYEDSVPGGVPEYRITIKSDDVDVVWAEA